MGNLDGMAKNLQVCKNQLIDWKDRMFDLCVRLMDYKNWFNRDKSNKNRLDHVLTAFIEETFDALPRVLTYLFISWLAWRAGVLLVSFF